MDNYIQLSKKYLINNKNRTINSICGIALSVALLFGMLTLYMSIRDCSKKVNEWVCGSYEIEVYSIDGKTYKDIVDDNKIKDIVLINSLSDMEKYAIDEYSYDIPVDYIYCDEVSEVREDVLGITLKEGTYPQNSNEIILSNDAMRNYRNFQIGDKIFLETNEKEYILTGVFSINSINLYGYEDQLKAYTLIDRSNQPKYCDAKIKLKYRNNVEKDYSYLVDKYKLDGELSTVGYIYYSSEMALTSSLLEYILLFFAFSFIYFLSAFIIRNSFIISIAERTKDYGILRCVGMSKKQLRRILLCEGLMLGSIASALGIIISYIGLWIIRVMATGLIKDLGYNDFFYIRLFPKAVILTIIFSIIIILFALIEPARVALLITPIDAILGRKSVKKEKVLRIKSSFIIRKLLGIEGEYAYKNIRRNRGKFISTCVGMSISIMLFVGMTSISDSVENLFVTEDIIYDGEMYDAKINSERTFGLFNYSEDIDLVDYIDEIKQIEGIDNIALIYERMSYCGDEKIGKYNGREHRIMSMHGYCENEINNLKEYVVEGNIDYNLMDEDDVILYNYCRQKYVDENNDVVTTDIQLSSVEVGDTIKIPDEKMLVEFIENNNNEDISKKYSEIIEYAKQLVKDGCYNEVTVVAIVNYDDVSNRGGMIIDSPLLIFNMEGYIKNATEGDADGSRVLFSIDSASSFSNVKDYVFYNRDIAFVDLYGGMRSGFIVLKCVKYILYIVAMIIIFICMFNLMNNLNSNIILRKKELKTYRLVGMSKKQVNKLLIIEGNMAAVVSTIIGSIIGGSIGYGVFKLIVESMNNLHFKIPVVPVLVAFVFTIGISMIATWSVIRKSKDI